MRHSGIKKYQYISTQPICTIPIKEKSIVHQKLLQDCILQWLSRESERGKKARLSTHAYNHDSGCWKRDHI